MKRFLKLILSAGLTAALVWFLLKNIEFSDVISAISGASPIYLLLAVAIYFMMMALRAVRFSVLLKSKIPATEMLPVVLVHNFMNNIIPFKMGELSYVYLLKKTGKGSYSHGISTLVIARVFDLLSISLFFFISLLASGKMAAASGLDKTMPFVFSLVFLLMFILFMLLFRQTWIKKAAGYFFGMMPGKKIEAIKKKALGLLDIFIEMQSKSIITKAFILSVLITLSGVLFIFSLVQALGYSLPINVLIIAIGIAMLTTSLPIYGIGGFGTVEGAWAIVLSYFGYPIETSIIVSFSSHIIQLAAATLFAFGGWLKLRYFK